MGLHNLPSRGLVDLMDELSGEADRAGQTPWYESLMSVYSQNPTAPLSTQAELGTLLLSAFRGLRFSRARERYLRTAETLTQVIEKNSARRGAIFIELVDAPSAAEAMKVWTLWKGTLFEMRLGELVVCWHPDKDFAPVDAVQVWHTGHSELGRRRRRRETAPGR